MFISGGFNVYPAEVEKLRPDAQADPAGLLGWARENMANYKVPRHIAIVDDLPRNAAGKVSKIDLAGS